MPSEEEKAPRDDPEELENLFRELFAGAESEVEAFEELPSEEKNVAKKRTKNDEWDLEHERRAAELEAFQQDVDERKKYARRIFFLICAWLFSLFVVLIIQGLSLGSFSLSDSVLLALIGGTTANVLGIFIIVVRYLFPK